VHFVGTGDLFTALITAWLKLGDFDIQLALEKTIASMQSVLNRTLSSAMAACKKDEKPSPRQLELKLIQSREEILQPQVTIKATKMMPPKA